MTLFPFDITVLFVIRNSLIEDNKTAFEKRMQYVILVQLRYKCLQMAQDINED